MITVGLPKGLFYYQHHVLWESFFRNIGCNIVVSENTNKEILNCGIKHCCNEICLPVKVFHGHVYSLKDKVDYIFIPRYISVDKNEYTCPKFCGLPDMTLLNLKNQVKILEIKLHIDQLPKQTYKSLKEIAKILNIKYNDVVDAFRNALKTFAESQEEALNATKVNQIKSKLSVSVLGHPYMIYDNYLSMKLIKKLVDRNINVYTPINLKHEIKRQHAYPFHGKVFWEVGFDNLGSAFKFAEDKNINGIIYLTPFACGLDSIIIEFIERRLKSHYKVPFLKLTIDEHTGEAGFDTRIEAFLDMMR
ncbi:acyl-CoA dehydratase activase-related protein [Clostridium sp. DJ247]|uniref:acyl-CoA dehydratase activase-related protein n=1 Tax=Clostridium sp. DJ247 TaxID=2726188 RepID=UPI0016265140|nr:acyl-CoA dehydratase activase-related protein [Clostridium sp. DJ247]MBC2582306.1 hypothetical protein [Clostridium sp. DJ247]